MAFTIDNLEIQIETNATKATSGIESLAASLAKLKTSIGDTSGLATNLKNIADALNTFSAVGKIRMTVPVNQLKKLESVVPILGGTQATQMADNLKKIADSIATFSATAGVGKQMKDAAKGMDALAKSTVKLETANNNANKANKNTLYTMSGFVNQYRRLYQVIDEIVDVCADWFNESNDYIEALNLFKVSMGDASAAALEYAEIVSAAMGIDPAEWISNQGAFQRMITGFGIVSDEAELMSQNLTQLAYDLSSFFNTDVTTAMEKLQSGMSGQIKGLKEWGYNLSVAALKETALALGIEETYNNMTEAQKAQLRYITLIQRSNGIMGDMAKTINTPSNAMRILDAQITQLKRSLGNLVSVIATKIIPYIQAFVEVIAEAAETLAEAWGFEIEDLPTNNLEMASEVIDGIGDDIDNTSDAVAGLKKQLAGFDELNILKSDDKTDKEEAQYSLGIDLSEYDFLSNLDNKTREKIDEIKKQINDLLPLLEGLAKAFAFAFAVKTFNDAKVALGKFFTETDAGVYIAVTAMEAWDKFKNVLKATKNPLKALGSAGKQVWTNFKDIMSSLSPLAKTLVSVVALGIEFDVVKDNVKGLADGSKSWGEALLAIIPTCGLVGAAMYAMWGPLGLVAAAVVGVTAAVVGWVEAENEARKQLVNDTFYDGYGETISNLALKFDELLTSSTSSFDAIFEKQAEILTAKDNIKKIADEVYNLVWQVNNGATTIEDAIPTIVEAFKTLYDETKTYLGETANLIYAALAGNVGQALTDLGIDIQGVAEATGKVTDDALAAIDSLNEKNTQLAAKFEAGSITDDEYYEQLTENIAEIQKWSGVTSETDNAIKEAKNNLAGIFADGINWDSENLVGDLEGFKAAADNAKTTIEEAYGGVIAAFEEQKRLAELSGNTDAANMFANVIESTKVAMQSELKGVDDMLSGAIGLLEADLLDAAGKAYDTAISNWDNLNFFERMMYGWDKEKYAGKFMEDHMTNIWTPIVDSMKEAFGDDAISIGDDTLYGLLETLPWLTGANGADKIKSAMEIAGIDTANGLISGLSSEQQNVYNEARALGMSVLEAYDEALDIHSPSKKMEERGKYTIQGLVNGLGDQNTLADAIDGIVGRFDILDSIKDMWKNVTDWWKNISLPDVDLKMPHFEWTSQSVDGWMAKVLSAIGLEPKLPKLNVEWYASGGFPTMGQMFIARERGPELVGRIGNKNAVANNDQIISGIASAVYSAMMAAQEDGNNGSGGSARIVVQIGDQAVGEASVRYINGQIVQTGTSPIYS